MGGGLTKPNYRTSGQGRSVQDEAISFRSKTSAIKILLRQEDSRASYKKYILASDKANIEVYLTYYEDAKMLKGDVDEIKLFLKKYSKLDSNIESLHDEITDAMLLSKSNRGQLLTLLGRCQEEALVKLSPVFNEYLKSSVYADYLSADKKREIRHHADNYARLDGSPCHIVSLATTATIDDIVAAEEPGQSSEQVVANKD